MDAGAASHGIGSVLCKQASSFGQVIVRTELFDHQQYQLGLHHVNKIVIFVRDRIITPYVCMHAVKVVSPLFRPEACQSGRLDCDSSCL